MRVFTIVLGMLFLFSCNKVTEIPAKTNITEGPSIEAQYQKEMDEIKKSLKGDVKIKLKKDGKGDYSWEITGKDAQEVLKANDTLRKKLSD